MSKSSEEAGGNGPPQDGSGENSGQKDANGIYENRAGTKKIVRVVTVMAYVFSVSFTAILLSAYYVFIWEPPNPKMIQRSRLVSDPQIEYLTHYLPNLRANSSEESLVATGINDGLGKTLNLLERITLRKGREMRSDDGSQGRQTFKDRDDFMEFKYSTTPLVDLRNEVSLSSVYLATAASSAGDLSSLEIGETSSRKTELGEDSPPTEIDLPDNQATSVNVDTTTAYANEPVYSRPTPANTGVYLVKKPYGELREVKKEEKKSGNPHQFANETAQESGGEGETNTPQRLPGITFTKDGTNLSPRPNASSIPPAPSAVDLRGIIYAGLRLKVGNYSHFEVRPGATAKGNGDAIEGGDERRVTEAVISGIPAVSKLDENFDDDRSGEHDDRSGLKEDGNEASTTVSKDRPVYDGRNARERILKRK
ncbi:uncharacterized protein LOC124414173 [Diprion similis]|uniref:uncharacterized protein LOC124414173 n=1 Tax=Diprion similis TaxID=362088 RepID=UPI001EF982A4|nr:uncharacterized protein LOC124414173 [Diprion similis]